ASWPPEPSIVKGEATADAPDRSILTAHARNPICSLPRSSLSDLPERLAVFAFDICPRYTDVAQYAVAEAGQIPPLAAGRMPQEDAVNRSREQSRRAPRAA